MSVHPPVLINIALAIFALGLYAVGSYRFYRNQPPFLSFLVAAVLIDGHRPQADAVRDFITAQSG